MPTDPRLQIRRIIRQHLAQSGVPMKSIRSFNLDNPLMTDDARQVMVNAAARHGDAKTRYRQNQTRLDRYHQMKAGKA